MGGIKIHAVFSSRILSRVTFLIQIDFMIKGGLVFLADDISNCHSSLDRSFVNVRGKGKSKQDVSWLLSIQFQMAK